MKVGFINRILDGFLLKLRIGYVEEAIHPLEILTRSELEDDAQFHIKIAKSELEKAAKILRNEEIEKSRARKRKYEQENAIAS